MSLRIRRKVLRVAAGALLFSTIGLASGATGFSSPRIDVVKIMSLSCPVCRAAEAQDKPISQAVESNGGKFVWAPLPTGDELSGAKELVYYASRELGPDMAETVKNSLYRGVQDMVIPLADFLQVYVWMQQDVAAQEPQFKALFDAAQAAPARKSLSRAAALATEAGVSSLPAYIVLVDGQVATVVDPSNVSGGSLTALREEVISRINKFSKR